MVHGVLEMIDRLPEARREKVVGALRRGVIFVHGGTGGGKGEGGMHRIGSRSSLLG